MSNFQIKDFLRVVDAMIEHARAATGKITDYNVGGVARSLLESAALELDDFYQALYYGLQEAIPTAIYRGFDFELLPAVAAAGQVEFSVATAAVAEITIPLGTSLVSDLGIEYVTDAEGVIGVGETSVLVPVSATRVGSVGNTGPGTINTFVNFTTAGLSVTNPNSITGGRDVETEDERAARFIAFVASLARGTVASLQYAAESVLLYSPTTGLLIERAERVNVEETTGHVNVWVHNGRGETSETLVDAIAEVIEGYYDNAQGRFVAGYRPAGMLVDVQAMNEVETDVTMSVTALAADRTAGNLAQVKATIETIILAAEADDGLVPSRIINAVLVLPFVRGATLVSPTEVVPVSPDTALVPGTVTVTWTP